MSPQTTLTEYAPDEQPLLDQAHLLKSARMRPIPSAERYPPWHARIRGWNQSPASLAELDYGRHHTRRDYAYDDREEPTYEQHFAEIHDHTDL